MSSPLQRYETDPNYRRMVDMMEALLSKCQFTPGEMREMAVMACMHFEMRHGLNHYGRAIPCQVNDAFKTIQDYRKAQDMKPDEAALK